MTTTKVVIGSRESILAVLQSRMVETYIKETHPEIQTEILTMKTTGDKILDRTLDKVGGKGLFVKELDKALLEKRTDLSVHSLKDMPMEVPEELPLLAFSRREDPRDVLVLPEGVNTLDSSKPIGCSSMRRTLQLKKLFPEMIRISIVRGNVQTRLRKLDGGEYSALVLAAAGLSALAWKTGSAAGLPLKRSFRQQDRGFSRCREEKTETIVFWRGIPTETPGRPDMRREPLSVILTGDVLPLWPLTRRRLRKS